MILDNVKVYDGTLLHSRFAYRIFREEKILPIGNIIAFRAPMDVGIKGMIDQEDLLNNDYIKSDDAINFCWEIPDQSAYAGVAFQRLFCSIVGNILLKYVNENIKEGDVPAKIEIDGDDIFIHKEFVQGGVTQLRGKASVSISCVRNGAVMGHLGINILAGAKAPAYAFSTNLTDEQVEKFMIECNNAFYTMAKSIWVATTKVI